MEVSEASDLWRRSRGLSSFSSSVRNGIVDSCDSAAGIFEFPWGIIGRLPESTAHCRPKNGELELLSICMDEPAYLHPAAVSSAVAAKSRLAETFHIDSHRLSTTLLTTSDLHPAGIDTNFTGGLTVEMDAADRHSRLPPTASGCTSFGMVFPMARSANYADSHGGK